MTELLLRIFLKDHKDPEAPGTRSAVGKLSGAVGIVCNLLLFAMKLVAGTIAGSVAITADAMNNLSDASSSIVTLAGLSWLSVRRMPTTPMVMPGLSIFRAWLCLR